MNTNHNKSSEPQEEMMLEERFQAWQASYHDYQRRLALFFKWNESFQQQLQDYQQQHQSIRDALTDLQRVKQERIQRLVRDGRGNDFW